MEDLVNYAKNGNWESGEESMFFNYPISLHDKAAIASGDMLSFDTPEEELRRVGPFLTTLSPHTHKGPYLYAIDFLVQDGTAVLAGNGGVVIEIVENFSEWGNGPEFRDKLNYLTIKHVEPSTGKIQFSQYCHLAKNSVSECGIKIGNEVVVGQPIARVGKSGWTDRDHLHFIVFRGESVSKKNPFGFRSLKVKFRGCIGW